MGIPVLVVHGVANRNEEVFRRQVSSLSVGVGPSWDLIPVFWGDLGATVDGLSDVLPGARDVRSEDRSDDSDIAFEMLSAARSSDVRGDEQRLDAVVRGCRAGSADASSLVRAETAQGAEDVEEAIREEWENLKWIPRIGSPDVLEEIGRSVSNASLSILSTEESAFNVRFSLPDIRGFSKNVLRAVDQSIGKVMGNVGGSLNTYLRDQLLPGATEFLGDVFVYQHQQQKIQHRLWTAIKTHAPTFGIESNPISVIAHSLGGLVAFDAAVASTNPLFIKTFVTFGSQPGFFQITEPRGSLSTYAHGSPVLLPRTIGRWTNYWEPWDILAFTVGRVFRLASGQAPSDIEVPHQTSTGLWAHSSYWAIDGMGGMIATALR